MIWYKNINKVSRLLLHTEPQAHFDYGNTHTETNANRHTESQNRGKANSESLLMIANQDFAWTPHSLLFFK